MFESECAIKIGRGNYKITHNPTNLFIEVTMPNSIKGSDINYPQDLKKALINTLKELVKNKSKK